MTNARYQRTRPMTNGRAPEQPHYAVITEDGWSSAPHPYRPSPVTGAHPAPPSREGAKPLAGPPITAGPRSPGRGRGAGSPRGCPRRRNKATRSGGSKRRPGHPAPPRPGHAAVHTHGLHTRQPPASLHGAPAAPVQAQLPRHGSTDTCFPAVRGHTMCSPDPGTHPPTYKSMHTQPCRPVHLQFMHATTETTYVCAHVCCQHACTWIDMELCTHLSRNAYAWTQILTLSSVHTIQGLQTCPHPHSRDAHSCINKC